MPKRKFNPSARKQEKKLRKVTTRNRYRTLLRLEMQKNAELWSRLRFEEDFYRKTLKFIGLLALIIGIILGILIGGIVL